MEYQKDVIEFVIYNMDIMVNIYVQLEEKNINVKETVIYIKKQEVLDVTNIVLNLMVILGIVFVA